METVLERRNAVKTKPRGAAPDDDVAMAKDMPFDRIGAFLAAELKDGGKPERDRNDRIREVALVPVLMEGEA